MALGIILVLLLILLSGFAVWGYNSLIRSKVAVQEAWSQITVQLKRRHDLIPNLVEAVKGYATHERGVFEEVTKARQMAVQASTPKDSAAAENMLSETLKSLFAVSEAYPDLKASTNYLALQEELSSTENKIAFSRQYYNDSVRTLNTKISTFPTMLFVGLAKATPAEFYDDPDESIQEPPAVKF